MNFWNMAVLGITFLAPAAAMVFVALKGERAPGPSLKACLLLFGVVMAAAAVGVARFDRPVKIESLWALTMEQSGYFEFSLQMLWSRFVWIFFTAVLLLGFMAYDGPSAVEGNHKRIGLLFLIGSFFFSVLAFLCENALLSLMFVEISAFLLHAFGTEAGGPEAEFEKDSYFKRSCFIFLGLLAMFGIAVSHALSTSSIMLMGAVLYILSTVLSKHNPSRWCQLPLLFVQLGMTLFLLERLLVDDASMELALPLSALFAVSVVLFSALSLLFLRALGASFWLVLSFLSYLLYLRFSSGRPNDPFWGAYEAIGLGAAYSLTAIFRFGARLDLLWKRALAFGLLAIFLGVVSGALPSVEIAAARFDSETSLVRMAVLGFLTFLVSAVSTKSLAVSLSQGSEENTGPHTLLPCIAPALLMLIAQVGVFVRWNDLNFESFASGGLISMFYDTRVLLTSTAVGAGMLAGALLGTNNGFAKWTRNRELKMEDFFPRIDPSLVQWNLKLVAFPERGLAWISTRVSSVGNAAASFLDSVDRGFFGDKFFRGLSEYGSSLSLFTRFFHSGQVRAYLFLGVLVTLFSSLLFLMEGR